MRFKHDCDKCKPLGQLPHYDLYYCSSPWDTVIARYGDIPWEYVSSISLATDVLELKIALSIAKQAGYIEAPIT